MCVFKCVYSHIGLMCIIYHGTNSNTVSTTHDPERMVPIIFKNIYRMRFNTRCCAIASAHVIYFKRTCVGIKAILISREPYHPQGRFSTTSPMIVGAWKYVIDYTYLPVSYYIYFPLINAYLPTFAGTSCTCYTLIYIPIINIILIKSILNHFYLNFKDYRDG